MKLVYKGKPVHFNIKGEGLPLIFLHGFNADSTIWSHLIDLLRINFKCVAIDLPGFGSSPLPSNLSLSYCANAVDRIVEENNLKGSILIGHSFGGYVLNELIDANRSNYSAAVLFHSTVFKDSEERKLNRLKTLNFLDSNNCKDYFPLRSHTPLCTLNSKNDANPLQEKVLDISLRNDNK
jgi:pimeloyl-ACP methyl ester carboxylesterase